MTITLALDPLTAMELPPVEFVEAAARNSCRTVPWSCRDHDPSPPPSTIA